MAWAELKRKLLPAVIVALLLSCVLSFGYNIKPAKSAWTGTVYIRADGSIDPPDAPITTYDNITYALTDNIASGDADGVVVERDNIVIDGAGFLIDGPRAPPYTGIPYKGINLNGRSNVTVKNINIQEFGYGIWLYNSSNIRIYGNNVTNNYEGIGLDYSSNNSVTGNNIADNEHGISLGYSSNYNSIVRNDIANNRFGIWLYNSSNNIFYHNNFIDNTRQVDMYESGYANVWDDGYPSGGNYWSDYRARYPDAEELDGSGLWDTPYVIDENNTDRYPLMYPYGTQTYKLTITATSGGTTNPSPGTHTYANGTIVEVTAIPNINYTFAYWELDNENVGSVNPIEVLMDSNHTLHAVFTPLLYYELTISSTPEGTTNPPPGTYTYVNGTEVEVTAIPDTGFSFDYWLFDGEVRTENPITILMDANHTLEAHFVDDISPVLSEPWQDPPPENVQAFQDVTVWINVTEVGSGIKNVTLWYSLDNGTTWEEPINMTALPIPSDTTITYEATIAGYENCTWVTYKIIAYDNAGNNATKDNNGYFYKYHVIPEFPSIIMLLSLFMLTTTSLVFIKKKHHQKTKS